MPGPTWGGGYGNVGGMFRLLMTREVFLELKGVTGAREVEGRGGANVGLGKGTRATWWGGRQRRKN